MRARLVLVVLLCLAGPAAAGAQERRSTAAASAGYAGFVDEETIGHSTIGAFWLLALTPRLHVGPELIYMHGPEGDRDVFLTGKVIFDFMPDSRVGPYVVADGGIMWHRGLVGTGAFWSREGAVSGGIGVRIDVTDRFFVAPEARVGWEPHVRVAGIAGWRFGS